MRQVNVLPVDVSQSVESKGILSSIDTQKSAGAGKSKSSNFSDYMADKSASYDGKKRQETANEQQSQIANDKQAVSRSQTSEQSAQPSENTKDVNHQVTEEKSNNQDIQTDTVEEETSEQTKAFENKSTEYVDATVENTRAEIATKLLDFINASEVTSTEHSQKYEQSRQAALEMAKQVNVQQQIEQSGKAPVEKVELSQKEQKLATEIQAILAGRETKNQSHKAQEAQAITVSGNSEANNENTTDLKKVNGNEKVLQTLASTEQLNRVKSASTGEQANSVDAENNTEGDVQKASQLTQQQAKQVNAIIDESLDVDTKKTTEPVISASVVNPALNANKTAEVDAVAVEKQRAEKPISVAPINIENTQKADNKENNTRIVNQATANVVNVDAKTDSSSTGDSEQQHNTEQNAQKQSIDLKANIPVDSDKQTIVEPKTERQVTFSEPTRPTTSLTPEQEQAAQAIHAKASAESVSVQATRSTQIIAQETIAINRKDFSAEVKEKVMVMINQKLRQLEIRLDPPELGSMQVKINMQNEQAAVNFVVQNPQAKDALEQHMGKLKEMLEQSGVDVGDANIEQRDQQTNDGDEAGGEQAQGKNRGENSSTQEQIAASEVNLYKASSTGVDYYA
ncbi:flagellar hook-length control protein FliK [Thalassotalea sp. 1_MG-2023]|uniref:flagellar hook-length control protein FliK n=1 Tax=Thalassotalea sp. 1_MG-2023 TaxID=3062680 RepID=UPI0026E3252B|nr:flagellar hook-length control protein FliK [Thalassotalea sp. 1_MG-2023]MDO6426469.1 flagellar hook-length control protein FliK [Thalassotalea sp. 1_MG-2023]